jgi:predicted secreted protein
MASNAVAGTGTIFRRWNVQETSGDWVNIAEINSITGPTMTKDSIDVTSLDSTGGYREFITGFRNAGTIKLSMNFTRASLDFMLTDYESDDAQHYEIVLPDAENTTIEFEGLVQEMPLSIPTADKITMDVTIQITGPITVNSGASSGLT